MARRTHARAVRVGRGCAGPLLRAGFGLRVEGEHLLPREGPALLPANHLSFLDPVILQAAPPRPIHYLMTARLHRDRRWQWLYRLFEALPVAAGSGNFRSLAAAAARLQAGEVVGVFPEGGISRDGTLQPFRPGVALLAEPITVRLLIASAATLGGVWIVLAQRSSAATQAA